MSWSRPAASACSTTAHRRRHGCGAPRRDQDLLGRRRAGDAGRDAARPGPSGPPRPAQPRPGADLRRRAAGHRRLRGARRAPLHADLQRARPLDAISRSRPIRVSPPTSSSSATGCRTAKRGSSTSSWSRPRRRRRHASSSAGRAGTTSRCRATCARSATWRRATTTRCNSTALAVLNIARESMATIGFSPATRVFEAAGAGACLITDAWDGHRAVPRARRGDPRCAGWPGRRRPHGDLTRGTGARDRRGGATARPGRAHLRAPGGGGRRAAAGHLRAASHEAST